MTVMTRFVRSLGPYTMAMSLGSFVLAGCSNIVPEGEAAAFARKMASRRQYEAIASEAIVVETSVGDFAVQLVPMRDGGAVTAFFDLVRDSFYEDMKFHRVVTEPVPFGLQIGDPITKGDPGEEFAWEATGMGDKLPIAGFSAGPVTAARPAGEDVLPNVRGSVALVGRTGETVVGTHMFVSLGPNSFLDGEVVPIGFVRWGQTTLDRIRRGTVVESMKVVKIADLAETLRGEESPLPDPYKKRFDALRPK